MMRSLWAGVSGLQNHQTRMDVLGNNIANVNTNGFKKGRVTFQDMLSQTLAGAAKPTDEVGGVNPQQVGLGMMVSTIDTIHTQGALQSTGVMTDVALQGNGFFVLNAGDKRYYTRNGAFGLDQVGRLVNPSNGMRVQGWMAQTVGGQTFVNNAAEVQDLIIPVGSKDPAQATTDVWFASNLDKRTTEIPAGATPQTIQEGTWQTTFDVFDSFGRVHKLQVNFTKVPGIANRWDANVTVDPGPPGQPTRGRRSGRRRTRATPSSLTSTISEPWPGCVTRRATRSTPDPSRRRCPTTFPTPRCRPAQPPSGRPSTSTWATWEPIGTR